MVKLPQKQTTYADYLYAKMDELLKREGGFTIMRLSEFAGLKVTGNMRRRVQHCVVAGTLAMQPALLPGGGSCNLFFRISPEDKKEFPF